MSSGPAGLQNKTCFLPCVLRNAHDAAPYAGTDSGCQLFFFTQPLTRFSVKIKAQAVRLAMIYMLKIYLIIFTLNYCELGINNFVYHSIRIVLFEIFTFFLLY